MGLFDRIRRRKEPEPRKTPLELRREVAAHLQTAFSRLIGFYEQGMAFEQAAFAPERVFDAEYLKTLKSIARRREEQFAQYLSAQQAHGQNAEMETVRKFAAFDEGSMDSLPAQLEAIALEFATRLEALKARKGDSLRLREDWDTMARTLTQAQAAIDGAKTGLGAIWLGMVHD